MRTTARINRISSLLLNATDDYDYIYDPEHRQRPPQGYFETEEGYSNNPKHKRKEEPSTSDFDRVMSTKKFSKPPQAKEAKLVWLDAKALENGFRKNDGYVGVGGQGGIGNRYEMFKDYFSKNSNIHVPEIVIKPNGEVEFVNGRHRFSYMRDNGATSIPVALYEGQGVMSLNQVLSKGFAPRKA
jgi:hypothetical protein